MTPLIGTGEEPSQGDFLGGGWLPPGTSVVTNRTGRPERVARAGLGIADRLRLFPPIHAAAYALRWVGLRDRLRCPSCQAVGTWKPHGTLSARLLDRDRPVRRWMCKWCGLYVGPEGRMRAFPDRSRGVWVLPRPWDPDSPPVPDPTPAEVVAERLGKAWPWRG